MSSATRPRASAHVLAEVGRRAGHTGLPWGPPDSAAADRLAKDVKEKPQLTGNRPFSGQNNSLHVQEKRRESLYLNCCLITTQGAIFRNHLNALPSFPGEMHLPCACRARAGKAHLQAPPDPLSTLGPQNSLRGPLRSPGPAGSPGRLFEAV